MKITEQFRNYKNYHFSEEGEVFYGNRFLKPFKTFSGKSTNGYVKAVLSKNGKKTTFYLHRIIAELFIVKPKNKSQVNHKDGNKKNNRAENLEWVTPGENTRHAVRNGLRIANKGEQCKHSKLTIPQVKQIKKFLKKGESQRLLARIYGVSQSAIHLINKGVNWKCV